MIWRNTDARYGAVSRLLHWLMAAIIIALFILGLVMTSLPDSHEASKPLRWWHQNIGLLLFFLIPIRYVWRAVNIKPNPVQSLSKTEQVRSELVHRLLYLLMVLSCLSGYLTASGNSESLTFWGWISIPTVDTAIESQTALAATLHYLLTIGLIGLAVLHSSAAVKHHVHHKDDTLKRMW